MRFYRKLYVGESVRHVQRVRRKLMVGAGQFGIYLITLAMGNDQLDIFHCARLKEPHFDRRRLYVAGIAGNMGEAVGLVEQMAKDSVSFGTEGNIKDYLLRTDQSRRRKGWK